MEDRGVVKGKNVKRQKSWQVVTKGRHSSANSQQKGTPPGSPPLSPTSTTSQPNSAKFLLEKDTGFRNSTSSPPSSSRSSRRLSNTSKQAIVKSPSNTKGISVDKQAENVVTKRVNPPSASHQIARSGDDKQAASSPVASVASSPKSWLTGDQSSAKSALNSKDDLQHVQPSEDLLQAVSADIPKKDWKWVFRELMESSPNAETAIEDIEHDNSSDLGEQKFQGLLKWLNSYGNKATVLHLDKALRKHNCSRIADKHTYPLLRSKTSQDYRDGPPHKKEERVPNFKMRLISVEDSNIEASLEGDTVTIAIPHGILHNIPKSDDDSSYAARSGIAVALLDTIINPGRSKHRYGMKFSELADRFEVKYGSCFKFRQLGVGKLATFIRNSCWFTFGSPEEDYVKQTTPRQRPSLDDSGVSDLVKGSSSPIDDSSDSEIPYDTCTSKFPSPCQTPFAGTPFSTPPPQRKKTRSQRNLMSSLIAKKNNPDQYISDEVLEQLLRSLQSKSLKFVLESEYLDKSKFSHDIVSLWNTPDRESSYIVVGVSAKGSSPHDCVGLNDSKKTNKFYQSLFLEDSFSYKPPYSYSEKIFEGKRYGVVTIPSSQGYEKGDPCYAEKNDPGGRWRKENICYCNPGNTICGRRATKKIIHWFGGSLSKSPTSPEDDLLSDDNQDWESVKSKLGELCHKRTYSLVVSRCSSKTQYLSSLGNFPWVKVWDFDPDSHESGVLNACKEGIGERLNVSTWKDVPKNQNPDGTVDWVFVRGMTEQEDSLMCTEDPKKWFNSTKKSLNAHCQQLGHRCENRNKPLLVVILWYNNFEYILHLSRLLQKIDGDIDDTKFVIIMPNMPKDKEQDSDLKNICKQIGIEHVSQIPLKKLCHELYHCPCPYQVQTGTKYMLPTSDGSYNADISESEALWYGEGIEVLYANDGPQDTSGEIKLGESFLAGGLLKWSDCDIGLIDAKRSLYKPLMQKLIGNVHKCTSAVVKLFHEPCAGGTTLGRRLLWDLHLMTPCACISSSSFNPSQVCERLISLYQKTNLPVVVLVDGAEPELVKELESGKSHPDIPIVILSVQQNTGETDAKVHPGNQYWLTRKVDYLEAVSLAYVFSHNSTDEKQRKLAALVEDVKKGQPHDMCEFVQIADKKE